MTHGSEDGRAECVERYLELLQSGGNDHPIDQLRRAGVDFNTTEPMRAMVETMDGLVDQLDSELRTIGLIG